MADNMMANPLAAALWGPDVMQKQYQVQQNQRIADMLMAQSQQPLQGQMVSGHYVGASPLQGVANLANALIARKTMDNIPSQQYDIANMQNQQMQQGFGLGGGQGGQQGGQAAQMGGGRTNPSGGQGGFGGGNQYPLLPGRSAQQSYQTAMAVGFPEYMKMVAQQGAPTDTLKNYWAAGMSQPQIAQAISGEATAKTSMDPNRMYTGPNGNPMFVPDMKNGIYGGFVNGAPVAAPISGWGQATAANERPVADAQNASKAQFNPATMVDERGNDVATNTLVTSGNAPAPGGKPPVIKRNPVLQESEKGLNDDWMKNDYRTAISNSESATNLVNTIKAMRMVDTNTGWGEGVKGSAASMLGALGVKDAANYASKQEKFQALAMDRLQTELMKQKGPQTEGDAQRASQTFAKLENTPAANQFILDFAEAKARQDMRKAAFFQEAVNQPHAKGDLQQINTVWNKIQGSIFDDPILAKYKE